MHHESINGGAWAIEALFSGKQPNIPLVDSASFNKAARESTGEENLDPDLPF